MDFDVVILIHDRLFANRADGENGRSRRIDNRRKFLDAERAEAADGKRRAGVFLRLKAVILRFLNQGAQFVVNLRNAFIAAIPHDRRHQAVRLRDRQPDIHAAMFENRVAVPRRIDDGVLFEGFGNEFDEERIQGDFFFARGVQGRSRRKNAIHVDRHFQIKMRRGEHGFREPLRDDFPFLRDANRFVRERRRGDCRGGARRGFRRFRLHGLLDVALHDAPAGTCASDARQFNPGVFGDFARQRR